MSRNIVSKVESAARPVVTGTSVMITSPAETSAIANMPCPPYLHGTEIETWRDWEMEKSKERRGVRPDRVRKWKEARRYGRAAGEQRDTRLHTLASHGRM